MVSCNCITTFCASWVKCLTYRTGFYAVHGSQSYNWHISLLCQRLQSIWWLMLMKPVYTVDALKTSLRRKMPLDVTFYTDEAWFHFSGYMNSQNTHLWSSENSHECEEIPLHDQKVRIQCATLYSAQFLTNNINLSIIAPTNWNHS